MKRFSKGLVAMLAVAALPLMACDDGSITGAQSGRVSILLTDAPGDFHQAVVTLSRIELVGQGSENAEGEASGVLVLRDDPWTGNLLELQNEVATLVENAVVPAGRYTQLRFVIPEGCIEVETETATQVYSSSSGFTECGEAEGSLQMPSFPQTGIKVTLPGGGVEISGDQKIILVDFDVAASFGQQAGASGMWVMHPVIHATEFQTSSTLTVSVSLAEEVTLPEEVLLSGFSLSLDGGAAVELSEEGEATFSYLIPGDHTLELIAPEGVSVTTEPATPLEVEIGTGAQVHVDLEITAIE